MASPSRLSFSTICILSVWKNPPRPIHVVSTKPMESSTSVSPSQLPAVSPKYLFAYLASWPCWRHQSGSHEIPDIPHPHREIARRESQRTRKFACAKVAEGGDENPRRVQSNFRIDDASKCL